MTVPQLAMFGYTRKEQVLKDAEEFWNPDKTKFWHDEGIPLVIGHREGYVMTDVDGHSVIDVHLNGGTFNLGHRNPELIQTLRDALEQVDVGNHHFPTPGRSALSKRLVKITPGSSKVVFGSSGGEAVDAAIKSARYATKRRKIISINKAYHGHTGLSIATGDDRFSKMFHSDDPVNFIHVPFNDISTMKKALSGNDIAAVIMETVPATYGFPLPKAGYLAAVKQLCEQHGSLYIADEVQTGLGRTGQLWGIYKEGVTPDILVTSKGLSGGIYPISAAILGPAASGWLDEDGFAHMSTFGGAELGCAVAMKVLEITLRDDTQKNVQSLIKQFRDGLEDIQRRHPDELVEIRQNGLVMGLKFAGGAKRMMTKLYELGIWAIFSTLDPSVLQFKPGLLLSKEQADKILQTLDRAVSEVMVSA